MLFWSAATFASAPAKASIKNATALWRLTRNSLQIREKCRIGVKGIFPLDGIPLWGREVVTLIVFLKRMESNRLSTELTYGYFLS
jgi:hypothetical protein